MMLYHGLDFTHRFIYKLARAECIWEAERKAAGRNLKSSNLISLPCSTHLQKIKNKKELQLFPTNSHRAGTRFK